MKIKEKRLREIVREEIENVVNESVTQRRSLKEFKYITEDEEEKVVRALGSEFKDFAQSLGDALEDAEERGGESARKDEGVLTAVSIGAAVPAIMKLVSSLGKKAGKYVRKMIGKPPNDESAYQKWMEKLGDIADELHHHYLKPIEGVVGKFVDDKKRAHKIAEHLFHLVVAILLVASGATAIKAFASNELSLGTLEAALSAIKSDELRSYITSIFGG